MEKLPVEFKAKIWGHSKKSGFIKGNNMKWRTTELPNIVGVPNEQLQRLIDTLNIDIIKSISEPPNLIEYEYINEFGNNVNVRQEQINTMSFVITIKKIN